MRRSQWQIWMERYKPIANINLVMAPGCELDVSDVHRYLFDPWLERDFDVIEAKEKLSPGTIWTLLWNDSNPDRWFLMAGLWHINRVGMLLSVIPVDPQDLDKTFAY